MEWSCNIIVGRVVGIKVSQLKVLLELLLEISVMFSQMLVYH